jgi:interferon-induced GTP-binding protein Mx1
VIDLPGIVRTSTNQQQSPAFKEAVDALLARYIEQDRTIILAVVPANMDIATVEVLERARLADPGGERTIGVLTKPDLIDGGTEDDLLRVLHNEVKPLKLGYVVVKNRSQKQVKSDVSLTEAHADEKAFFQSNAKYSEEMKSNAGRERFGVEALATKLTGVLVATIRRLLPAIRDEMTLKLRQVGTELDDFKNPVGDSEEERKTALRGLVKEFVDSVKDAVEGDYRRPFLRGDWAEQDNEEHAAKLADARLYTRAYNDFENFQQAVFKLRPEFRSVEYLSTLKTKARESKGRELPGFLNSDLFAAVTASYVKAVEPLALHTAMQCVDRITVATGLLSKATASNYPSIASLLDGQVRQLLHGPKAEQVKRHLKHLFEQENDPFTLNHYYTDTATKILLDTRVSDTLNAIEMIVNSGDSTELEKSKIAGMLKSAFSSTGSIGSPDMADSDARTMSAYLESYWKVAMKRIIDGVCMMIDNTLLKPLAEELFNELMGCMDEHASLMAEDESVVSRRENLKDKKKKLSEGLDALREFNYV